MKKSLALILVAFVSLSTLSGCWSRKEVSDLAIAVALGIDKNGEDEYIVSTQIINPSETATSANGGGYDTPVTTYTTKGKILFEALRQLSKEVPRKVYLAHLRMIVLGEEVAKEGIYDALDFLSRDPELRTDFYIIIAKNHTAKETLKILTSIEKIPANKLFNSIENSFHYWAETAKVKLNELMDDIVSEGIQPTLTGIMIKGDPKKGTMMENIQMVSPETLLTFNGIAAFRENKLVGWLDEKESKGFNYIRDNVKSTVIVLEVNDGDAAVELVKCKVDIVPHFKGGSPSIEIKVTGEGNVADVNTKLDLMKTNTIDKLEEKTNNEIKDGIQLALDKGQKEFKTDIFGFGKRIHKDHPKEWKKLKQQWKDIYPDVPVFINSQIKLRRVGTISNPFHNELKED